MVAIVVQHKRVDKQIMIVGEGHRRREDIQRDGREKVGVYLRSTYCVCRDCKTRPFPLYASVVDHVVPHKGDMKLFWDRNNWQSMNKKCHDKKTAHEDSSFARGGRGAKILQKSTL